MQRLAIFLGVCFTFTALGLAETRDWTRIDKSGKPTGKATAEYLGCYEGTVLLLLESGKVHAISPEKLSEDDRGYLKQQPVISVFAGLRWDDPVAQVMRKLNAWSLHHHGQPAQITAPGEKTHWLDINAARISTDADLARIFSASLARPKNMVHKQLARIGPEAPLYFKGTVEAKAEGVFVLTRPAWMDLRFQPNPELLGHEPPDPRLFRMTHPTHDDILVPLELTGVMWRGAGTLKKDREFVDVKAARAVERRLQEEFAKQFPIFDLNKREDTMGFTLKQFATATNSLGEIVTLETRILAPDGAGPAKFNYTMLLTKKVTKKEAGPADRLRLGAGADDADRPRGAPPEEAAAAADADPPDDPDAPYPTVGKWEPKYLIRSTKERPLYVGRAVIHKDTLAVPTFRLEPPNQIIMFQRNERGDWVESDQVTAKKMAFPSRISLSENRMVVQTAGDKLRPKQPVFVFDRDEGGEWKQVEELEFSVVPGAEVEGFDALKDFQQRSFARAEGWSDIVSDGEHLLARVDASGLFAGRFDGKTVADWHVIPLPDEERGVPPTKHIALDGPVAIASPNYVLQRDERGRWRVAAKLTLREDVCQPQEGMKLVGASIDAWLDRPVIGGGRVATNTIIEVTSVNEFGKQFEHDVEALLLFEQTPDGWRSTHQFPRARKAALDGRKLAYVSDGTLSIHERVADKGWLRVAQVALKKGDRIESLEFTGPNLLITGTITGPDKLRGPSVAIFRRVSAEKLKPAIVPKKGAVRDWTRRRDRATITAEFLGFANGLVKVRKEDGEIVNLRLEQLSDADKNYIKKNLRQR